MGGALRSPASAALGLEWTGPAPLATTLAALEKVADVEDGL